MDIDNKICLNNGVPGAESDIISSLPDAILQHILSFLETKHAVQTCVLSRRWLYVWTSVPCLNFRFGAFPRRPANITEQSRNAFVNLMQQALSRHCSSHIHRFSFFSYAAVGTSHLRSLVSHALRCNAQIVEIACSNMLIPYKASRKKRRIDCFEMPDLIYTSKSLHVLKLTACDEGSISLPRSLSFMALKELHLNGISLLEHTADRELISDCPNLECLTLVKCEFGPLRSLKITAPQLTNLEILFPNGPGVLAGYWECNVIVSAPKLSSFKYDHHQPLICSMGNPLNIDSVDINIWKFYKVKMSEEYHERLVRQLVVMLQEFQHAKSVTLSLRAIKLAEWMSERKYLNLSSGDVAVKLDLIAKVHGVGDAEKYFSSIPNTLRTFKVYGALLNCYAKRRLLDKAETVMQEMRKLGYNATLSYDVMLNLYAKLQKHEKLHNLFQEMEEMGITCGRSTFCILLNAYADSSNLEGMEKMLSKMEDDLLITMNWHVYVVAAKGYLKAGLVEKTSDMLQKAEKHIASRERKTAYLLLLSTYASLGNKLEVHRIWDLYKAIGDRNNVGYLYMVSSLIRMDDIDEAEKILEEWESGSMMYDFRIPNLLINAYTKKGLLGKAEALVSKALESGKEPPASTWDFLATGYFKDNQMEKAVETMRKAILANRHSWKLNHATVAACLKYLKEEGHVEKAEEFATLLTDRGLNPRKPTRTLNFVVNNQQTNVQACRGLNPRKPTSTLNFVVNNQQTNVQACV